MPRFQLAESTSPCCSPAQGCWRGTGQGCALWGGALSNNKGTTALLTQSKLPECLEAKEHQLGSQIHNGFSLSLSLFLIAGGGEIPVWWRRVRKAEMELKNPR